MIENYNAYRSKIIFNNLVNTFVEGTKILSFMMAGNYKEHPYREQVSMLRNMDKNIISLISDDQESIIKYLDSKDLFNTLLKRHKDILDIEPTGIVYSYKKNNNSLDITIYYHGNELKISTSYDFDEKFIPRLVEFFENHTEK